MSRRAAGQVLLLRSGVVLLGLVFSAGCGLIGRSGDQDARAVFCLAPAQRSALVEAAVTLGLAQHGSAPDRLRVAGKDMPLETWRVEHRHDFARGCAALQRADQPPSGESEVVRDVIDLGRVAFGALLGALAGEWRAKVATGRLEADALRAAVRDYARAVMMYVDQWQNFSVGDDRPDDRPVRERQDDADAYLRRCHLLHPRWRLPSRLRADLTRMTGRVLGALGAGDDWADLDPAARDARAGALRTELADLENVTDLIAANLERPLRPHPKMTASEMTAPEMTAPEMTAAGRR